MFETVGKEQQVQVQQVLEAGGTAGSRSHRPGGQRHADKDAAAVRPRQSLTHQIAGTAKRSARVPAKLATALRDFDIRTAEREPAVQDPVELARRDAGSLPEQTHESEPHPKQPTQVRLTLEIV